MPYTFSYFSKVHIESLLFCGIVALILIPIPKIIKKIDIVKYSIFLGFFTLFMKILDSIYRVILEKEVIYNVMPIHLCNFAVIISGIYLIFRKRILFNLLYYYSFGAALALLLPGVTVYYHKTYVFIFMLVHIMEFVGIFYGFIYFKEKISFKGFLWATVFLLCMFIYAHFYNLTFDVNAMFLKEYIVSFVSFIKPFILYKIILVLSMILFMYFMYLIVEKTKIKE